MSSETLTSKPPVPSTFGDSVKFYDQMSQLQGELKTYESQKFELEQEFQRLWNLGERDPLLQSNLASSNLGMEPKLTELGNTMHYQDGKAKLRLARNQAILDKIQELETNASVFAARSDRLKMMKNEYENLVRKHAVSRKSVVMSHTQRVEENKGKSIGVNTDITGPIKACEVVTSSSPTNSCINIDLGTREVCPPFVSESSSQSRQGGFGVGGNMMPLPSIKESATSVEDSITRNVDFLDMARSGVDFPIRKPTFPDISSSSSNESIQPGRKNAHEISADSTTSLSLLLPRPGKLVHGINHEVSESTPKVVATNPKRTHPKDEKPNLKDKEVKQDAGDDDSIGEVSSIITPDSFPKDDSELGQISQEDENKNDLSQKEPRSLDTLLKDTGINIDSHFTAADLSHFHTSPAQQDQEDTKSKGADKEDFSVSSGRREADNVGLIKKTENASAGDSQRKADQSAPDPEGKKRKKGPEESKVKDSPRRGFGLFKWKGKSQKSEEVKKEPSTGKKVRLKVNYDDSESEYSEKAEKEKTKEKSEPSRKRKDGNEDNKNKPHAGKASTKQEDLDAEFQGFFD